MFARVVRYEAGREEVADQFIDQVLDHFDAMEREIDGIRAAFLITRRSDGEAIEVTFWDSEQASGAADEFLEARGGPESGATEVMTGRWQVLTGRRPDASPSLVWEVARQVGISAS